MVIVQVERRPQKNVKYIRVVKRCFRVGWIAGRHIMKVLEDVFTLLTDPTARTRKKLVIVNAILILMPMRDAQNDIKSTINRLRSRIQIMLVS